MLEMTDWLVKPGLSSLVYRSSGRNLAHPKPVVLKLYYHDVNVSIVDGIFMCILAYTCVLRDKRDTGSTDF